MLCELPLLPQELECDSTDLEWLKESCYRCLLYMGDIGEAVMVWNG